MSVSMPSGGEKAQLQRDGFNTLSRERVLCTRSRQHLALRKESRELLVHGLRKGSGCDCAGASVVSQ